MELCVVMPVCDDALTCLYGSDCSLAERKTAQEFPVGARRSVEGSVWATGPAVRRGELRERGMAQRASAQDAGLFGVAGLHAPRDFVQLAEQAGARVLELCKEVEASGEGGKALGGRALLQTMDEISDTLCLVMDAAELCRSVHPDPEWKGGALEAYNILGGVVSELNAFRPLYQALVDAMTEGNFSEEEWRMAALLKADFEKGGVHLDPAGRAQPCA
ncbi:hypothetical protein T484DRAFT_1807472 [Baffinella frigidus]|nr:hypothetical protein T484DRAFT_1807472 [Cryptophyta sp. CCMP2293]